MQGLDEKKHQSMIRAIGRFEESATVCGNIIPRHEDEIIRERITEFKGTHDYYRILLKEQEGCIRNYKGLHDSLQKRMYPQLRKMDTELCKKRGSRPIR